MTIKKRVLILGASGRDFHDFLTCFKDNPLYEVIGFTQAQIPGIEKRSFPKSLAGRLYKKDIPFYPEEKLKELIKTKKVDEVVLAYSDLSHQEVMQKASLVLAAGANFRLFGTKDTYVHSKKPVIAVTAVRTGSGKSQTSRALAKILRVAGKKVVGIRHSMPYGKDLTKQTCQRFASEKDFAKHHTTIEEEEEYQPWIDNGFVIYAGFDYKAIVRQAEKEADIIIFDGGNNDISMIQPDLHITVADPHRPGHELSYYPGYVNVLLADVIIINKIDSAKKEDIAVVEKNIKKHNPKAIMLKARSEVTAENPSLIRGKSVALIEDGPTITHGGMQFGAATIAAQKYHASKIIAAKPYAVGSLKETYQRYLHISTELPAMGYDDQQIKDLQATINKIPCDTVIDGSPANLKKILKINKPIININYELDTATVSALKKIVEAKKFI